MKITKAAIKAYWKSEDTEGLRYFLEKSVVIPVTICYTKGIATKRKRDCNIVKVKKQVVRTTKAAKSKTK